MNKLSLPVIAGAVVALATVANGAPDNKGADFLKTAIQGDNSEIMLGRMAAQNATVSPGVKQFAQMLVDDHSAHLKKVQSLAQAQGVKPPTGPMAAADVESAKLHLLKGDSFDKEFIQYMVNDHQKDIADYQQEAARHDGDVSKLAQATIPTLRKHLDAALKLQKR
ncbi:MAG TPA: DUF4142 domain-containing protein [Caulobacteraceae bacterium]|jgi:putative membrane protein|nr:DUF4142 domain-containing protein [Caulobacteraceae bacterium]